jgi:uncharacterized protein (TIGR03000 family)
MCRAGIALVVLAALTPLAGAQPQPQQLPLAPGVMPASPIGPGTQFLPAGPIASRGGPGVSNAVYFPVAMPWGWGMGWGYQTYNPWVGFGYSYGGILPTYTAPAQPVGVDQPQRPEPVVVLVNEFPATLTVQFPAAAEVWVDGTKVKGDAVEEQILTSPVLKPTQQYTFLVKARWTMKGKTYEAKRAVTLGPGDRSRLMIVSGDEVRE